MEAFIKNKQDFTEKEIEMIETSLQHTYGRQSDVQAKMAFIAYLAKGTSIDDETQQYFSEVLINGLCGGWVEVFKEYPDWVEPIYNTVRSWTKPGKITVPGKLLQHFEGHLSKTTKFSGAKNVIKLLRDVFDKMGHLEPDAGYTFPPDWTNIKVGSLPISKTFDNKIKTEEASYNLRNKNASELICNEIKSKTNNNAEGECMVHIESDLHHMVLRVQKLPNKKQKNKLRLLITVVETEKSGIVKTNNWNDAQRILNNWLEKEEPNLKEIDLRTKIIGFDADSTNNQQKYKDKQHLLKGKTKKTKHR